MPSSSRLPLAVVIALLLSLSLSCPAATAKMGNDDYGGTGGRVVTIIHGRGTTTGVAAAATTGAGTPTSSKWQRRLEEVVAPEFGSMLDQGYIKYDSLKKDSPACGDHCAAQGASYTQPCLAIYRCRGGT